MNSLQNYLLFSSDRGGMRIEYAKHKMGEMPQSHVSVSTPSVCLANGHHQSNLTSVPGLTPQPQTVVMVAGSTISTNNQSNSNVTGPSLVAGEPMELIAPIEQC
jgi:hypothetical protein